MERETSLWYRGICDVTQPDTLLGSPTYTNSEIVACCYAVCPNDPTNAPDIIKSRLDTVKIDLGKTVCLTDSSLLELTDLHYQLGFYDTLRVLELVPEAVTCTDAWQHLGTTKTPAQWFQIPGSDYSELCLQAYRLFDSKPVVDLLVRRGYHTAVYGGSGYGIGSLECRVFDPTRIEEVSSRALTIENGWGDDIDPWDPNLTDEQIAIVLERYKHDPFYFLNRVVRKRCQTGAQTQSSSTE